MRHSSCASDTHLREKRKYFCFFEDVIWWVAAIGRIRLNLEGMSGEPAKRGNTIMSFIHSYPCIFLPLSYVYMGSIFIVLFWNFFFMRKHLQHLPQLVHPFVTNWYFQISTCLLYNLSSFSCLFLILFQLLLISPTVLSTIPLHFNSSHLVKLHPCIWCWSPVGSPNRSLF